MKHNFKVTAILVLMFLVTQLIGLFIIQSYTNIQLPYGMQPPEEIQGEFSIFSLIFSFILAITLFFILTKVKAEIFIKAWFFIVTVLALGLTLNIFLLKSGLLMTGLYSSALAIVIALPLTYFKIYKRNYLVHNITELLIYPGIAAVFVPLLGIIEITILLLLISFYDMWAVWKSKFMQKMANYQMNNLRIFTGFFLPYANKKQKQKIKRIKNKYKTKKAIEKHLKKSKIKINLGILGGGDIIFPIITAGVVYRVMGLFPALIIAACATLSLISLFILSKKGKYYPAMPFLTLGLYLGILINLIV